jgi:hypothetical protein
MPTLKLICCNTNPLTNQTNSTMTSATTPEASVVNDDLGKFPQHPPAHWDVDHVVPLNRDTFISLLKGTVPAIRVSAFVSRETCRRLVTELSPKLVPYLHATGPAVQKVGLAQFEFQAQSQEDLKNRTGKGELLLL